MIYADLQDKTVLVTGASSGFGAHFARLLASSGATVLAAARRGEALDALVASIQAAGGRAFAFTLDVTEETSIAALFDRIQDLHVVVNNAGVTVAKPAIDQTIADWDLVLNTNLRGAYLVATAAARHMRRNGAAGSIINIASILGVRQAGNVATYAISKAGMIQMTKSLALEFARFDIRVNALAPGYYETDLNRDFWSSNAGQSLILRIPQRRLGQLADLDGPLMLLATDASRYMTGSVITVDGGHLVSTL